VRLALYEPDIPQNAGTILRMAACLGVPADVIGPTGFDMTDRSLRRAGLDYLDHVDITRHASFDAFDAFDAGRRARPPVARLVLLTTHAETSHLEFAFARSDIVMLGRESAGVPERVHAIADARVKIPMQKGLRSLNIAVAGAIALSEALRQTGGFPANS